MNLFKNSLYVRLFAASLASQLGTVIGNMALAFYLLDKFSTQPYYTTLAKLANTLPMLAVFLFVGVIADRLDRKKIAANCDWIRAVLTLLLLLALHEDWLVAAFAVLFLRSAVGKFFGPAEAGLVQGILNEDQYTQAAGMDQTVGGLFMLFGMGLGSFAYQFLGIEGAVIIDGVSFLLSGALIASCRFAPAARQPNGAASLRDVGFRRVTADFAEGYRYIAGKKLLLVLLSGFLLFGFVNGVFTVLPIFTMKYKLHPEHYQNYAALINVFLGLGFLGGSAVGSYLIRKLGRLAVLAGGLLTIGLIAFGLGWTGEIAVYLLLMLITGTLMALTNIAIYGWIPSLVEPSSMGRVHAWNDPLLLTGQAVSLGVVSVVFPRLVAVNGLYAIVGAATLAIGILYATALPALSRGQPRQGAFPADAADQATETAP